MNVVQQTSREHMPHGGVVMCPPKAYRERSGAMGENLYKFYANLNAYFIYAACLVAYTIQSLLATRQAVIYQG